MIRTLATGVVLLAVVASASAQSSLPSSRTHRSVPADTGIYTMSGGFELAPPSHRSGPEVIFDNTGGAEYYFTILLDTEEYVDECAFPARDVDGDEQINGVDFSYCSFLPDAAGTGVSVELRFYNDTVFGAGPTGWLDLGTGTNQNAQCTYILDGLPGDTSGLGLSCWDVQLDLECGFECSLPQEVTPGGLTELNGIGWMYRDALGSGLSGPLEDSIFMASHVGYGSQDYFEVFDTGQPLGNEYVGAVFFGGTPKEQGSFHTILYGNGILDTDVVNVDPAVALPGDNFHCLSSDTVFESGASVTWSSDTPATAGMSYVLVGSLASDPGGFGGSASATVLVDPSQLLGPLAPLPLATTPGVPPSFTTPPLPAAVDTITVNVQLLGLTGGGPSSAAEASNALRHSN